MDERAPMGVESAPGDDLPGPRRAPLWLRTSAALMRVVVALVSVAVIAATGYGWWTFGDIDANTVTTDVIDERPQAGPEPLDGAVDILLVGIDSRTDAFGNPLPKEVLAMLNGGKSDGERNTDTMILVHIPSDGKRAVAFSFPRDSWVDVGEGFGKHKLNSAFVYAYNDARKTLGAQGVTDAKELDAKATVTGRKNLIATIERLVGESITIDRYAEVNLASFYEVTKAIGGVEVCLNNAVDEPKSGARLPAGRQTISGAAALSFVRQRYDLPNGDLDRIVRQQVFLGALANKVLSADMLANPSRAKDLVTAVQKSVVLSSNWNLSRFAAQMQGLSSGNIEFHTIPTQGEAKIGGADVIKVDPAQVAQYVEDVTRGADLASTTGNPSTTTTPATTTPRDIATPGTPTTSGLTRKITVDVRNGSTTRGLATTVLDALAGRGYARGDVGDAAVQPTSVIRYAAGELAEAEAVAGSLAAQFSYAEDRTLSAGHVRVVLGTSYQPGSTATADPVDPVRAQVPTTTPANTPATIAAGSVPCVN
ncbi:LCP family protein [Actinokineospora sp. NBRC 105648]|uniref:LCP family protein n=1 Tax=Actinokineospora sp. NBRC 105648 TaxID=3032206 RepID=UPI0024A38ED1|nr:LCP family protein [Actinokineospora sp. NBRC 105648]GLZ38512.1 LytTR family transcriptional regulator [Actinokineospora sp. NBRC 105648]